MSYDFLIVGLGNPDSQYAGTRHNIGFMCVENLAQKHHINGKTERKMEAIVGLGTIEGKKGLIAQPLTYMNLSGNAVIRLVQFYKIPLNQILIAYDDTALPFGKIRLRAEGSAGSHNGMKSVLEVLGKQNIPRLRIGIGNPPPKWDLADFVLAPFTPEEQAELPKIVEASVKAIELWIKEGPEKAMTHFNSLEIL